MAVEARRGCGFRKINGLYLVADAFGVPCDRLPFALDVCPTCSHGLKYSRGWTWVDVDALVGGPHVASYTDVDGATKPLPVLASTLCKDSVMCPLCTDPKGMGRAGLVWIGEKFYPTPEHFILEGKTLGISRRIKTIPHGFKLGETWVLFAHIKAVESFEPSTPGDVVLKRVMKPGIFQVFKPQRIEKIITESQSKDTEEMEKLEKRGITAVIVPDDDLDHQGSVWDKPEQLEFGGIK